MKHCLVIISLFSLTLVKAQIPDHIYASNIKSIKFNPTGNPLGYAVWTLGSGEQMELHFDDVNSGVRNYSYTYVLCNADWTQAMLSQFDYISGFSEVRLSNYRTSSIAFTRYTHYQAVLPDRSCTPSRSGNYLLKIFADGDTSKVLFTRRFLVLKLSVDISALVQQPFNGQFFKTTQKIQFSVNASKLNLMNPMQQVSVCILQNNRWDNYIHNLRPTFIRQGVFEYNTESDALFPAGREWRWLDLRSFRLQSDRVERATYLNNKTEVFVKPDMERATQGFVFYRDANGMFYNTVTESVNPLWQADYATVHFRYAPRDKAPYPNKNVYLFGEVTNYGDSDSSKMTYNEQTGMYETSLFLKQGFYDYSYITKDADGSNPSFSLTEGNFFETENVYTILVYYRSLGGRSDELIGFTRINSLAGKQSIGF